MCKLYIDEIKNIRNLFFYNRQRSGSFYHCFGCGEGGDIIKFIQTAEYVSLYIVLKNYGPDV